MNRSEITVYDGTALDDETGRDIYQGYRISEIRTGKDGYLTLETPSNTYYMQVGDVVGDIDPMLIQRHMIRRTIREHLDKELRLNFSKSRFSPCSSLIRLISIARLMKKDFVNRVNMLVSLKKNTSKPLKALHIKIYSLLTQNMRKTFMMVISPSIKKVHGLKQAKAIMQAAKMLSEVITSL